MKHKFTTREIILILICAVLALGIFYYEFAYKRLESQISSYSTETLTDQMTVAQAKAVKYKQMKDAIAKSSSDTSTIAVYDNLANEVAEVGNILNGRAENINITWNDPALTDTTVRRSANIAFDTNSYSAARQLVNSILSCKYRNVVTDLEIASNTDLSLESSDDVTTTLTVTFFETINGAATTKGLSVSGNSAPAADAASSDTESSTDGTAQ